MSEDKDPLSPNASPSKLGKSKAAGNWCSPRQQPARLYFARRCDGLSAGDGHGGL